MSWLLIAVLWFHAATCCLFILAVTGCAFVALFVWAGSVYRDIVKIFEKSSDDYVTDIFDNSLPDVFLTTFVFLLCTFIGVALLQTIATGALFGIFDVMETMGWVVS